MRSITCTLNGIKITTTVPDHLLLVEFIRNQQRLTGTHIACETSQCGACVVLVNGKSVKSCSVLAVEIDGCTLITIEGLAHKNDLHPMQQAFAKHLAAQCGFCTPGMIISAIDILNRHASPSEQTIRNELSGNFCRCTGYQKIVEAIQSVAKQRNIHAHH